MLRGAPHQIISNLPQLAATHAPFLLLRSSYAAQCALGSRVFDAHVRRVARPGQLASAYRTRQYDFIAFATIIQLSLLVLDLGR